MDATEITRHRARRRRSFWAAFRWRLCGFDIGDRDLAGRKELDEDGDAFRDPGSVGDPSPDRSAVDPQQPPST